MKPKRTTCNIDDETYRYLYKIALLKLDDEDKKIFNNIQGVIDLVLNEIGSIIEENHINFKDSKLLKFIKNTENQAVFLVLSKQNINILDTFENKIQIHNTKIDLKRNQIIKTMTILYYDLLIKCG